MNTDRREALAACHAPLKRAWPSGHFDWQKDISGCGIFGAISRSRALIPGSVPVEAMRLMHDRGNGLGGGFAAYGIYPEFAHLYAFHLMCEDAAALDRANRILAEHFDIHHSEPVPTRKVARVGDAPLLRRFFVKPREVRTRWIFADDDDYVVNAVMFINARVPGVFVASSGKNMGAFKGVGYPEDMAEFYRLDEYKAHIWTAHNRFPTNTPGWWGGAHPFCLLDVGIVHNGEISSYGINRRYLAEHGYECVLQTDTEVVAYLLDLLIRRHGLSRETAARIFAPPLWEEIDAMPPERRAHFMALRTVYGSAMLGGPFAILVSDGRGLMGLNDRMKLRPLVVGEQGDTVYLASEESAIRRVCPGVTRVWTPRAGEPVIVDLDSPRPADGADAECGGNVR